MENQSANKAIPLFAREESKAEASFEQPVFETIEDFKIESEVYRDGTLVHVTLRRQLNYKPSRFSSGPYWLDLCCGRHHEPRYGLSEERAREAACRFLLEHVNGIAPTRH